jgi:hypothetical protein
VDHDRCEEIVPVSEMGVWGADRNADAATGLGQGEISNSSLIDQLNRGLDEGRAEVSVVVSAGLSPTGCC